MIAKANEDRGPVVPQQKQIHAVEQTETTVSRVEPPKKKKTPPRDAKDPADKKTAPRDEEDEDPATPPRDDTVVEAKKELARIRAGARRALADARATRKVELDDAAQARKVRRQDKKQKEKALLLEARHEVDHALDVGQFRAARQVLRDDGYRTH